MATSIRDLLREIEAEAPYAASTERQSVDALGGLSELGRALRQLAADGLELDVDGRRSTLARDLAESCAEASARMNLDRDGRLTRLGGGLADVVTVLRAETGRDQRWAIAVQVATCVRTLTSYAAAGDRRRTADLAWARVTARALIVQSLRDSPSVQGRAVLDRTFPQAAIAPATTPTRSALESMTVLSERLRRASVQLARHPTLLEIFAVTKAAESTARYATTATAALAGDPIPDARPAAAIWYEVRDRLRPFVSAAPLRLEDRDLSVWAQRAHGGLGREFGKSDHVRVIRGDGAVKADAIRDLQAMVNEVPAIASHLATAVRDLADRGELIAIAKTLPYRYDRTVEFLQRRVVIADRFDVTTVIDRLGDAAKLGAELATTLNTAAYPHAGRPQPDLHPAPAARALEARAALPDPHAPLVVQRVDDGMAGDAAPTIHSGQVPSQDREEWSLTHDVDPGADRGLDIA